MRGILIALLDTEATPTKVGQTRNVSLECLPISPKFLSQRLCAPSFIVDPDGAVISCCAMSPTPIRILTFV